MHGCLFVGGSMVLQKIVAVLIYSYLSTAILIMKLGEQ